jgi:hypothetical protein
MSRLLVAVGFLGVLAVGFVRVWRALMRLVYERAEVDRCIRVFTRYMNSRGADGQAYGELIERSLRVQDLLGDVGFMAQYVAPFGRYSVPNYQVILNGVPAMRRDFEELTSGRSDHGQLVGETLVRYMGWSADRIGEKQRELRNPVGWFREGIAALLLVPLWLFRSLGLLSGTRSDRMAASALFRLLTGLLALIGLVGSIFTIVLGWSAMKEVVSRLFGR